MTSLQWRHNGRDGVSNHQITDCLLNIYSVRDKENIKAPRHRPLCGEFTGEFPAQMASNTESVDIWWRHHVETLSELHAFSGYHLSWSDFPCQKVLMQCFDVFVGSMNKLLNK